VQVILICNQTAIKAGQVSNDLTKRPSSVAVLRNPPRSYASYAPLEARIVLKTDRNGFSNGGNSNDTTTHIVANLTDAANKPNLSAGWWS